MFLCFGRCGAGRGLYQSNIRNNQCSAPARQPTVSLREINLTFYNLKNQLVEVKTWPKFGTLFYPFSQKNFKHSNGFKADADARLPSPGNNIFRTPFLPPWEFVRKPLGDCLNTKFVINKTLIKSFQGSFFFPTKNIKSWIFKSFQCAAMIGWNSARGDLAHHWNDLKIQLSLIVS